ncbi:MAG: hypothetical protein ABII74_05450 [Elusimicrobiota bacterium]
MSEEEKYEYDSNILSIKYTKITDTIPVSGANTSTSIFWDQTEMPDAGVLKFLEPCGRNWRFGKLENEMKYVARVHHKLKSNSKGNFYTLIWSWKDIHQVKEWLELDGVAIDLKTKFVIRPGCLIAIGNFKKNNNHQIYVKEKEEFVLEITESTTNIE